MRKTQEEDFSLHSRKASLVRRRSLYFMAPVLIAVFFLLMAIHLVFGAGMALLALLGLLLVVL